jgi:hypothetical protein
LAKVDDAGGQLAMGTLLHVELFERLYIEAPKEVSTPDDALEFFSEGGGALACSFA